MKIKIGKYEIKSDGSCFVLTQPGVRGKDAKVPGEKYSVAVGYYTTIESALDAIPTKALLDSDVKSLAEVKKVIQEYRGYIRQSLKEDCQRNA